MPKSPSKGSGKSSTSTAKQFSITSFLPSFGPPSSTSSTLASSASSSKKSGRKRDEVDVEVLSSGSDGEGEKFKVPAVPVKRKSGTVKESTAKGKKKAKKAEVLDLTSDDELLPSTSSSPPPEKPKKKAKAPAKSTSAKGKGKARTKVEEVDFDSDGDAEDVKHKEEKMSDGAMWVDQYAPRNREDLALHPRKLLDVQTWLCEAFTLPLPEPAPSKSSAAAKKPPKPQLPPNPKLAKYRRVLVLSGAAGAAKTAALKVLCEEMEVGIVEWAEGMRDEGGGGYDEARESMVHRFSSFLSRAGMAPALDFGSFEDLDAPSSSSSSAVVPSTPTFPLTGRRLILLEDLPNVSHYPTKLALRSAIAQYLSSPRVNCPLVVIISEALARPGTDDGGGIALGAARADRNESLDARSVLGVEILQHPACREIPFNPIAPTIMRKALSRTLDRVYSTSSSTSSGKPRSRKPPPASTAAALTLAPRPTLATLDALVTHSSGDIRSALMSLQFLLTQGGNIAFSGGGKANKGGKGKKRKRGSDSEEEEEGGKAELLQFVTARESSLFIFHALGKVLYNKRWGDSAEDDKKDLNRSGVLQEREYGKLPKHLREEWDRRSSKVDPDVLFAEAPLDPEIFLTYLHHNYPPFTNEIDECCGVLEGLSAGDALMGVKGVGGDGGEEAFRRATLTSHYAFHLSVRSTLLSLPSPVPRRKQVLRKSELWETLKLSRANEDGLAELLAGGSSGLAYEGYGEGADGLRTRRERGTMAAEVVPWLGVIRPKSANPFLLDLATFPPLASSAQPLVTGDALGEKDLEDEEDVSPPEASPPVATQAGRGRTLQELEDEEERQEGEPGTEGLFDEDDDIQE
ncbi:RFC checkpoint protein Rad17 [Rhodosporidiobolus nylandii]